MTPGAPPWLHVVGIGEDGLEETVRDALRLDRRRLCVIFRGERVEKGLREPELVKRHVMKSNMKRPREDRAVRRGQRAPRVNWSAKNGSKRGPGLPQHVLPKPFTIPELRRTLQEMEDAGSSPQQGDWATDLAEAATA